MFPTQKYPHKTCSAPDYKAPTRTLALVPGSDALACPHSGRQKNNSIPIDPSPAQFNAFYPQCSGQYRGSLHESFDRRSTADRILDIINAHLRRPFGSREPRRADHRPLAPPFTHCCAASAATRLLFQSHATYLPESITSENSLAALCYARSRKLPGQEAL